MTAARTSSPQTEGTQPRFEAAASASESAAAPLLEPVKRAPASQVGVGLACAIVGAIGFSGKAILAKLIYQQGADAVMVISLRMLFALPVFVLMAWWGGRGKPPMTGKDWATVVALGFTGYYASSYADFIGLQFIGVNLERMILYLSPTIVLLLNFLVFRRKVSALQALAVAIGYSGMAVVFIHEAGQRNANLWLGAGLVFLSASLYAVYLIFSGESVRRLGSLRLAGWASTVACLFTMLTFVAIRPLGSMAEVPGSVFGLSLLNATACTVAPVLLVMMGVERLGPTLAAQAGMIGPLSTIALSVAILGEAFTASLAVGTALVMLGIWLLARWR